MSFEVQGAALFSLGPPFLNPEEGPTGTALRNANMLKHEVRAADIFSFMLRAARKDHLNQRLDSWQARPSRAW